MNAMNYNNLIISKQLDETSIYSYVVEKMRAI